MLAAELKTLVVPCQYDEQHFIVSQPVGSIHAAWQDVAEWERPYLSYGALRPSTTPEDAELVVSVITLFNAL